MKSDELRDVLRTEIKLAVLEGFKVHNETVIKPLEDRIDLVEQDIKFTRKFMKVASAGIVFLTTVLGFSK